jgi:adenosylcobinamide-GDP ribazoletransferase
MTLLTRVPMPPARSGDSAALARAAWAYPLVGAFVGSIGAASFALARALHLSPEVAAWMALAAMILATGCFHEDGLADFWDGIGGGHTIDRKLEIMRDSRIGSYGAAALILSLGVRAALIASLDNSGAAEIGCVVAGLFGRVGIVGILTSLGPARADGLAATAGTPPIASSLGAFGIGAIGLMSLGIVAGLAVAGATALIALLCRLLMKSQIGGYTGDGLGATEQKTEIAVLVALCATAEFI